MVVRAWIPQFFAASLAGDMARCETLWERHVHTAEDLVPLLKYAQQRCGMTQEELCDEIEDFLERQEVVH